MRGLFRGKYLIAYYDANDFPIFVASDLREFANLYEKYNGLTAHPEWKNIHRSSGIRKLYRHITNPEKTNYGRTKIVLIEADSVIDDCFKDADEDFIKFIKSTTHKTNSERIKETGISRTNYYRKLKVIKNEKDNRY